jgi:organic radical activating enzyme
MHNIPRLDFMIAYSCNLACKGCISLSDFDRDGVVSIEDIATWCEEWHTILSPEVITLFGGEPTLHPKLPEICKIVRDRWPNATIRLITNGYLLDNFSSNIWFNYSPFEIQVSIHRLDHEHLINAKIKNILLLYKDWYVTKHTNNHKQLEWSRPGFKIYKSKFGEFIAPYQLQNGRPIAALGDPYSAHAICGSPDTPVLYKNKLYKCPAVANVIDYTKENWLGYQPMASTDDLTTFISLINKPESVCAQCPDQTKAIVFNHQNKDTVVVRQKNLN